VAAAAERLRVVGGEGLSAEGDGELVERAVAGEDAVGFGRGPAVAVDRQRQRPLPQVRGHALGRLDLQLGLDLAARDRVPLGQRFFEPLQHCPQLELAHELAQGAAVGLARHRRLEVHPGLDVVLQGRQLFREPGVVGVLGQVFLAFLAGDLVDVFQHPVQRAELLQQLGRGFLADPGDAGNVVGGVAAQTHQVGDQLRGHPVALLDRSAVVDLRLGDPARGAHHPHPLVNQLIGVAVAGHDHHLDPLLARLLDQRSDHVVGLVALDLDVGVAEGLDQRHQVRPLLAQQVGARFALGLVEVVGLLAAAPAGVPGDDHALRVVLVDDFHQHRGEAVDRVGRAAVAGPDRLRQGEEGAVGEAVAVDQEELGRVGHAATLGRALAETSRSVRSRPARQGQRPHRGRTGCRRRPAARRLRLRCSSPCGRSGSWSSR
jgi:hypothetical protein